MIAVPVADPLERRAIVSGIGQSAIGRRLHRGGLDLTIEAVEAAVADAGLTLDDVDGVSTYPGSGGPFGGASGADVHDALRLRLNWRDGGLETAGQLGAVHKAVLAVAAGLARHVVVFRTVVEGSGKPLRPASAGGGGGGGGGLGGGLPASMRYLLPYGAGSAANWIACYAMRHMHDYGTTREQLGAVAINARGFAALNPQGIYTEPMSMEDYLAARMISEPFCLYDCDVPCDGSTAVIVSHRDFAPDAPQPVAQVQAMGTALRGRPSWDQFDDLTTMAMRDAAASLWERTHLTPDDVDTAQLYDGFSWLTIAWLEALGFCGRGEGGPFVEGGKRIGLGGSLPLNTWGGQLSSGRLHGFGFLHEAVLQLRGGAGTRQVPGAEVAAVAAGGGPECGCLLLTKGVG
ncbi:MAG TPA: thiolase family protein [Acidimicrobiales bacterium]|nr:thiolase family protein [Acidimicrobiales bacterium]